MPSAQKCAVLDCKKSRYRAGKRDTVIHSFPQQIDLYRQWVQFCGRDDQWKPSGYFGICSHHFRKEDYQMENSPRYGKGGRSRILFPNAIPSIFESVPSYAHCESEQLDENLYEVRTTQLDPPTDDQLDEVQPLLLEYRDQFCRVCLAFMKSDSLVPVDTQIKKTTVLDMLIQLTAFETESNDAYPTVMCTECLNKLEHAFNVRQEFIAQTELLVQMVAEQTILNHFEKSLTEGGILKVEPVFVSINDDHSNYTKSLVPMVEYSNSCEAEQEESVPNDEAEFQGDCTENTYSEINYIAESEQCVEAAPVKEEPDAWNPYAPNVESDDEFLFGTKRKPRAKKDQSQKGLRKRERVEAEARKRFPLTTCYICNTQHETTNERDFHMREHIAMLPYQCNECATEQGSEGSTSKDKPPLLKTSNQLNRHFMMHHMPYKCDQCYRRFRTTIKLKTHLWDYHGHGANGLTCEYCGKQFFRRILFRTHVYYHRMEQSGQFKCSLCDRVFGSKDSLRRHEASHTGEKKYKCMYCDKLFSTSYNRITHQRIHTGERPYKCSHCDRAFVDNTRLRVHEQAYHKQAAVAQNRIRGPPLLTGTSNRCSYPGCDYTAKSYAAMYSHKRTKHLCKHQCDQCSKSFAYVHQLKNHMSLHTGEKPYQCEQCDRKFVFVENYRRHRATHMPVGNCICTICQKSFKQRRYLQAHMLTHTDVRKFACEACGSSFKTNGELKKHILKKHSAEVPEEPGTAEEVTLPNE